MPTVGGIADTYSEWLSKPKIDLADIDRVMKGQQSRDPLLVINSMHAPSMHVDLVCMAAERELPVLEKTFEEILYIVEGNGVIVQNEGGREQTYEFSTDDMIYTPPCVPTRLVNKGKRPLKFVRQRGLSLNPGAVEGVWEPWPEASNSYFGASPLASHDIDIKGKRIIRSAERQGFTQLIAAGAATAGTLGETPKPLKRLQRGIDYPTCGSRMIKMDVNVFAAGEQADMLPSWHQVDEIIYVVEGYVTERLDGPGASEVLEAGPGDILYQPPKVVHQQQAPGGAKILVMCGVFLMSFFPEFLDGVHGAYTPENILIRRLGNQDTK